MILVYFNPCGYKSFFPGHVHKNARFRSARLRGGRRAGFCALHIFYPAFARQRRGLCYNKINIVKVNVDASKNLVKELKLSSVPYLALYHKGEIIYSKNGAVTQEELTAVFKEKLLK